MGTAVQTQRQAAIVLGQLITAILDLGKLVHLAQMALVEVVLKWKINTANVIQDMAG
jgi:hypothetical protein